MLFIWRLRQTRLVYSASASELEGYVYDALPIDGVTGCIRCWLKTCCLYCADGRVAKAVAEIAGDAEHLDNSRGGDTEANRDGAFDVELDGFSGVLWTRLEENFRR